MNRLKTLFLAAFAVLTLGITPALAVTYFSPLTGFEDDDLEWHIDTNNNGLIDVGERLVGVAEFHTTYSITPPGSESPIAPQELTAVFDLTVVGVDCALGNTVCQFTFAPTGAGGELATRPDGTAVTLWLDDTPDLDVVGVNCNSLAECVALASDGEVFLDGGFYGDPDAFWIANAIAPIGQNAQSTAFVQGLNSTQSGGTYNFCLNVDPTTNNTGFALAPQPCGLGETQIAGGGVIKGGQGLTNGAFARSDNDFQLRAIPEPSAMLLLGFGLLGINLVVRRRNKNK